MTEHYANANGNGAAGPAPVPYVPRNQRNGYHAPALRPPNGRDKPPKAFSFVYPHQIQLEPRRWLIPGLMPRSGFGLLFGPSGCGKSFMSVHLALTLALGLEFLGRQSKRAGVMYVAAEDAAGVQFRIASWLQSHGVETDEHEPIPLAVVPEAPDLWSDDGDTEALVAAIQAEADVMREYGAAPGLIIIDTMRDALPGMNENGSDEMSAAVATLRRIGAATGAFVLVVHHVPKQGDGEDPRGSTALIGAADVALGVRLEEMPDGGPPERVMWIRKQRNGPDSKGDQSLRWAYSLKPVELDVIGEDGAPETSCVVRIDGDPTPKIQRKQRKLSPAATIVRSAVVALFSNGQARTPPREIRCPANTQAVWWEDARDMAEKLGLGGEAVRNPDDAVRKSFARGKQQLIAEGQLFEMEGWLWLSKN